MGSRTDGASPTARRGGIMNAAEVAHALSERPKKSGDWWRVPCVAHDSNEPNLALMDGDKGGLAARCHSRGCTYKAIMQAIEQRLPGFSERWDYGAGRVQVRRPSKKFAGSLGKTGGPLLLHGSQTDGPLVIVEGERTALAVVSAGFQAATYFKANAQNADFGAVDGREVVVWPDKDDVGRQKGEVVLTKCQDAGAELVRVVAPRPEWPDKADAADLDIETIRSVVKQAEAPPVPLELQRLDARTWAEIGDPPPRNWLLDGWLLVGDVTLLTGEGGVGKSRLALQIAAAVASGGGEGNRWIAGDDAPQLGGSGPVIYASWEDDLHEQARRLAEISNKTAAPWVTMDGLDQLRLADMSERGPLWGAAGGQHQSTVGGILPAGERLQELADEIDPVLVVLDPLAACFSGNENDRAAVRPFLTSCKSWAHSRGLAVLILAHPPKSGAAVSGSTDWQAAPRSVWTLGKEQRADGVSKRGPDNRPKFCKLAAHKLNYDKNPEPLELDFETTTDGAARWRVAGRWSNNNHGANGRDDGNI